MMVVKMADRLAELITEFRNLKDTKEALEDQIKEINKAIKVLAEKLIPEYMEENDIDKTTIAGVGTVHIQQQLYTNVKADDREELYTWLRESGNEDMIKDWVFPQSLKAFCKEQLENGKPIPEMVTAHFVPTAILRRK